jgi:dienelactone hydrolase
MWHPDSFLEELYQEHAPSHSFTATTIEEWHSWRSELVNRLILAIALPERHTDEVVIKIVERQDCGAYMRERIEFITGPRLTMPCYVLIPKEGQAPYPAIVACPGHGYGAKQLIGLEPDGSVRTSAPGIYKDYPIELVHRGFMVIVPELLGLGDRRLLQDKDQLPQVSSCARLATNLLVAGKTLLGQRVREMMDCVAYLSAHPNVIHDRIGCMGFSGGGLVLAITAAIDERIRAAVISGYTNTYKDSILAKPHCLDNYIPGILNIAELPDLFGLIAPRALFIESGLEDLGFPIAGAKRAISRLQTVYTTLDRSEQLETDLHAGHHEVSGCRSFDWLEEHLKV